MTATATRTQSQSDHDALVALNRDYINAVQNSDVKRFDEILAPEFYCSNPDGSLVDRAGFLRQTAQPVTIRGLEAKDVLIRIFSFPRDLVREPVPTSRDHAPGDVAIIHARTVYTKPGRHARRRALHRLGQAERALARRLGARDAAVTRAAESRHPRAWAVTATRSSSFRPARSARRS